MATLVIKRGRAKPLWHGHPWIYAQAVQRLDGEAAPGDVVEVTDDRGTFIGRAAISPQSALVGRMLTLDQQQPIDRAWLRQRLQAAMRLRRRLGLPSADTNCYRLVNSEGDGLPGLVVDVYGPAVVVQFTAIGLYRLATWVYEELEQLLRPTMLIEAEPGPYATSEGIPSNPGLKAGRGAPVCCRENGLSYELDILAGQKTGLFLDQRENHALVGALPAGERMLDIYCYHGGFALHAARAGWREVIAVDASAKAVQTAGGNAARNGLTIEPVESDAMRYLAGAETRSADLIVADPPKFATRRSQVEGAVAAYTRLSQQAIRVLREGGMYGLACCSQLVDAQQLRRAIAAAAAEQKRRVQLVHISGAGADHPTLPAFPEGDYLKFILCTVAD